MRHTLRDDARVSDADELPRANPQWGAVLDEIYRIDVRKVYEQLSRELTVDWGSMSLGRLHQLANSADARAFEAAKLHRASKLEEERVEDEIERQFASMREAARRELAVDKAEKKIARAPSAADVDDRVRQRWPDRWRKLREQKARIHGGVQACEELLASWRARSATLRAMLTSRRPAGGEWST